MSEAADTAPFSAFEQFKVGDDVPEAVRAFAEKGLQAARGNYDTMKAAAEQATSAFEDSFTAARAGALDLNRRLVEYAQAQTDAAFGFARRALGATSFAEIVTMQSAFLREQFEAATERSKELRDLATKVTTDATTPLREATAKSASWFKAA